GSTFGFALPQKKRSDEVIGVTEKASADMSSEYRASFTAPEAEILIVDDNSMNLKVVTSLLKETQLRIDTALSGRECLEAVKNKRYHLILLDHMMPEMDGIETLERLRSEENLCRDIPVIVITANAVSGSKEMYLSKGFSDYLPKPVESAVLEGVIMKYLPEELVTPCSAVREHSEAVFGFENINEGTGLRYFSGKREQYIKALRIYSKGFEESCGKICSAYDKRDIKNYGILVHALKSTSLGIGAEKLSEMAKALETAAKENRFDFIEENHAPAMELYQSVVNEIKQKLDIPKAEQPPILTEISESDYIKYLNELKGYISSFNSDDAETVLNKLRECSCKGYDVSGTAAKLKEMVDSFQWSEAEEFLESIM
ncbi:MAG: response regulator, partial [Huintestinicola sp.]